MTSQKVVVNNNIKLTKKQYKVAILFTATFWYFEFVK